MKRCKIYLKDVNGYVKFVGTENGRALFGFVGMDQSGNITTFHFKSLSKLLEISSDAWKYFK